MIHATKSKKFFYLLRSFLSLCIFFLLTACQSTLKQPKSLEKISPAAISSWSASGKLGYQTSNEQGSVVYSWQHTPTHDTISLSNTFGLFLARIEGNQNQATLTTRDGIQRTGSAEFLLFSNLGYRLPISALDFWLRGLSMPNSPATWVSENQLKQSDWVIDYLNKDAISHLPTKLRLMHEPSKNKIVLLIQWDKLN